MDNTTKLFWELRRRTLEEELSYNLTLKRLLEKASAAGLYDDVDDAHMAAYVFLTLDDKIDSLRIELSDPDDPANATE